MNTTILNKSEPILIFPSVLIKYSFTKHEELKVSLFEIINKKFGREDFNSHHSETLSFYNNKIGDSLFNSSEAAEHPILKEFKEFSIACANDYAKNIQGYVIDGDMICTNSWLNYYSVLDSHQEPHVHVNSFISSNYFANFDKEKHAPLMFKKQDDLAAMPFLSQRRSKDLIDNPSAWDTAYFEYNQGDIIFWQSHMFHFVPKSLEPGRLSLACNYMPEIVDLGGYGFRVSEA